MYLKLVEKCIGEHSINLELFWIEAGEIFIENLKKIIF